MSACQIDVCAKLTQHPRNIMPVKSSTRKYLTEMGAPQLRHLPPRYTQVISGIFRYQGIEYLQCGQCDGGETTLWPNGSRWMQTLRKLPTMQPKMNKTTDQNWN